MKKNIFVRRFALILTLFSGPCLASQLPRPLLSDARIKVITFKKNDIIPLYATTFTATEIQFSQDERIENIQNGDVAAWSIDIEKNLPNILFIKPTIAGSDTNMTVLTNKRTYYFHLISQSISENSIRQTYALKFIYPEERKNQLLHRISLQSARHHTILNSSRDPNQYHWNYSFNGSRAIMPLHVFDDGKFTYMQLRSRQTVPAIFAVETKNGNESVVNFRREGRYLVIHRLSPQFTLREGPHQVASIFNNALIDHYRKRN